MIYSKINDKNVEDCTPHEIVDYFSKEFCLALFGQRPSYFNVIVCLVDNIAYWRNCNFPKEYKYDHSKFTSSMYEEVLVCVMDGLMTSGVGGVYDAMFLRVSMPILIPNTITGEKKYKYDDDGLIVGKRK